MKKIILKKISAFAVVCIITMTNFSSAITAEDITMDEIPVLSQLKGDINKDYSVTAADLFAFRYYLHGTLIINDLKNADMDENGEINILDYVLMKNAIIENF